MSPFKSLSLLFVIALAIGACASTQTQSVSPAAQTATAIVEAAADEQLIRNAEATATAMAGGVASTDVVHPTEVVVYATPTIPPTEQAPAQPTAQMNTADARANHLVDLREVYDSQGWAGWLRAAGIVFDESKVESRQPVETGVTVNGQYHTVVEALVIRATGMKVSWPACVTTDRPNEVVTSDATRQHQPDLQNPSVMYTNVTLNGQGTIYADCSDWGQLAPKK